LISNYQFPLIVLLATRWKTLSPSRQLVSRIINGNFSTGIKNFTPTQIIDIITIAPNRLGCDSKAYRYNPSLLIDKPTSLLLSAGSGVMIVFYSKNIMLKTYRNLIITTSVLLFGVLIGGYGIIRNQYLPKGSDIFLVQSVSDGDTFRLDNGERVGIIGINSPEKGDCFYD
jgi:hypothetical protein